MNSKYDSHTLDDGTRIEWISEQLGGYATGLLYNCNTMEQVKGAITQESIDKYLVIVPPTGITATLNERGSRYGVFAEHAYIAQSIQNVMRAAPGWTRLSCDEAQALTVIADKIARILNGDPHYTDNWHDIQGYAKLVEDRLNSGEPTIQ